MVLGAVDRVEAKACISIWADNRPRKESGFLKRILLDAQAVILPHLVDREGVHNAHLWTILSSP